MLILICIYIYLLIYVFFLPIDSLDNVPIGETHGNTASLAPRGPCCACRAGKSSWTSKHGTFQRRSGDHRMISDARDADPSFHRLELGL